MADPDPRNNFVPDAVRHGSGHVHLIAVCGVAMAALAGMLKARGFRVTGSDEGVYPPMSTLLANLGIGIREGYLAAHLDDRPDLVVVGNKVSRGNPEVEAVLERGLPFVSLPQALAELFLADRDSLVVAGTHGKTTSTAMLAWVLESAGLDPSVLVGGHALNFDGNYKLGAGRHFVLEGDEYDTAFFDKGPKFLHYRPNAVLLNAVEFDHADIYRDLDHVKSSFRALAAILPAGAPAVVAADFPHALDVFADLKPTTFGLVEGAEWRAVDLRDDGRESIFTILHLGKPVCEARLQSPGAINVRNALGVFVLAQAVGVGTPAILEGLRTFRGVARRQQLLGEPGGVAVIDDFAHHPTAVAGAIAALRSRYPQRRLWAVFEPRSNTSRRKVFQREYVDAFAGADAVIIGGVLRRQSDAVAEAELFSPDQLAADIVARGQQAEAIAEADEIAATLARETRPGDVVLLMSNGNFGGVSAKLLAQLRSF
jgi:UDP-N-acetylmuramate: L-alanyl-gamma-D-glutamyl-meso-diaminopimelate ligase